MKNEKVYVQKVKEGASIRTKINDEIKPFYGSLKKIFSTVFKKPTNHYKTAVDLMFYKAGYPKEDSPSKIQKYLDSIGNVYTIFALAGKTDMFNSYLKENYGVSIDIDKNKLTGIKESTLTKSQLKRLNKSWNSVFTDSVTTDKEEIVKKLLETGQIYTGEIVENEDKVRVAGAEEVESKCDIPKSTFTKAVQLKYIESKKGSDEATEQINKMTSENIELKKALEVVLE